MIQIYNTNMFQVLQLQYSSSADSNLLSNTTSHWTHNYVLAYSN